MPGTMESTLMEALSPPMVDKLPSPRTLCTHRYPDEVPLPFNSWDRHFLNWKKFKCENPNYPIHTVRYEDLEMGVKLCNVELTKAYNVDYIPNIPHVL
ncbi:hypothetical protein SNE40_012304 [Patella caerulea]|uniref:Uncharacterized protein n=1 Tax=Patella caerulea TaxID=87958 RepID=A0AAN8JLH8_PATCE